MFKIDIHIHEIFIIRIVGVMINEIPNTNGMLVLVGFTCIISFHTWYVIAVIHLAQIPDGSGKELMASGENVF